MTPIKKKYWWEEEYGFFGSFYMDGDNSKEGYLIEDKQNLIERTKTEVEGVIKLLSLKPNASILDCPCGYGRHSIELARRGFKVTGSDINSIHLSRAVGSVGVNSVMPDFKKENMLDLKYDSVFDAVINIFYSFGFFDSDKDNEKVLTNFFNALKPGGKFLMHTDVNLPRVLSGKYKHDEKRHLINGKVLRIIDKYNPETKRIDGSWVISNGDCEERKDYSVRVYTREEFVELCKKTGFTSVVTYSDWRGDTYSENAEDMIVVATK